MTHVSPGLASQTQSWLSPSAVSSQTQSVTEHLSSEPAKSGWHPGNPSVQGFSVRERESKQIRRTAMGPVNWGLGPQACHTLSPQQSPHTKEPYHTREFAASPKQSPPTIELPIWYSPAERPRNLLNDFDAVLTPEFGEASRPVWDAVVLWRLIQWANPPAGSSLGSNPETSAADNVAPDSRVSDTDRKKVVSMFSSMSAQLLETLQAMGQQRQDENLRVPEMDGVDIWLDNLPLVATAGILSSLFFDPLHNRWSPRLVELTNNNELCRVLEEVLNELGKDAKLRQLGSVGINTSWAP